MVSQISVVINTFNEEKNIERAVNSVKWADEILICDMHSDDNTLAIAKKLGVRVVSRQRSEYVEPARNFAISKASNEWVLVLDPDEEVTETLRKRLIEIASKMQQIDYVRIPRKNLIFGKWMQASMWWPDLNIRFFKKGKVEWSNEIHRPPKTIGTGLDLPSEEKLAITHHNYQTISQFITRMDRYTTVEAKQLFKQNYELRWQDLIEKPLSEFLSRFFANRGYQDGLHGLALSLLQAYSFLIVYLKVWENYNFIEKTLQLTDLEEEKNKAGYQINYWIKQIKSPKKFLNKILMKFRI